MPSLGQPVKSCVGQIKNTKTVRRCEEPITGGGCFNKKEIEMCQGSPQSFYATKPLTAREIYHAFDLVGLANTTLLNVGLPFHCGVIFRIQ